LFEWCARSSPYPVKPKFQEQDIDKIRVQR
jgi:hypothetical protein